MSTYMYRNTQMESELLDKIKASAHNRYGEAVPTDIQKRIAVETQHIIDSGHGVSLAAAAALADYSAAHGYPVGIRGLVGNLYVAHLLVIAVNDPLELGLRWEGCLGLEGNWMPEIIVTTVEKRWKCE